MKRPSPIKPATPPRPLGSKEQSLIRGGKRTTVKDAHDRGGS